MDQTRNENELRSIAVFRRLNYVSGEMTGRGRVTDNKFKSDQLDTDKMMSHIIQCAYALNNALNLKLKDSRSAEEGIDNDVTEVEVGKAKNVCFLRRFETYIIARFQ